MSDKLLPIDRVAELDNVGVIEIQYDHGIQYDQFHCFLLFHLSKEEETYIVSPLAMQEIKVTMDEKKRFLKGKSFFETRGIATPHQGGYGAAIHDFVLWWMYTNIVGNAVSIADRGSVKPDAARVREIYANARKGSIDAFPIDNENKRITYDRYDDYETHFDYGGFDVYPEYKRQPMANDPEAYKDWAVQLTDKGYREIAPACEHLNEMGNHILSFMENKHPLQQNKRDILQIIISYANEIFDDVYFDKRINATRKQIALNKQINLYQKEIGNPHEAPILDKTKKTTQKLGSYTYNPRRRTRRIR